MSKEIGNEAAFPVLAIDKVGDESYVPGLTKREYFAGLAMQGLCATHQKMEQYSVNNGFLDVADIAQDAVKAGDALIAELSKQIS